MQWRITLALERAHPEAEILTLDGDPPCIVVTARDESTQLALVREASGADALFEFMRTVPFAGAIFNHILTSPYEAISVVDAAGIVRFLSPMHEHWLGLRRGEANGKPARVAIPNSRLEEVAASGQAEIGHLYSPDGVATRVVSRVPVTHNGRVVGAVGRVVFKGPEVVQRMHDELARLRAEVQRYRRLHGTQQVDHPLIRLVGDSAPMQRLRREVAQVADLDVPVLILGESGTGKELVARALHELSGRKDRELVNLNLAALPASLLESELFGYAPGAFTGGLKSGRPGKFELADRGTLFLDEVGDIPMEIQVKLLRVLEDQVVERIAEHRPRKVNFRLVSATHRDIGELIKTERFRMDLYYRIGGVTLTVPPLRERLEDIPALLTHFVEGFCRRNQRTVPRIDGDVEPMLAEQAWRGNVRELRQRVEEALVFCMDGRLSSKHFRRHEGQRLPSVHHVAQPAHAALGQTMLASQKELARQVLAHCKGNKSRAAQQLGVSRSHLYKLLA